MRKKLMSCVVALAFIFSIASSTIYAAEPIGEPGENSGVLRNNNSTPTLNPDNTSLRDAEVNKIVTRFTSVFKYGAGILLTVLSADGGLNLFEGGAVRASFVKNENGSYSLSNFSFRPNDIDIINQFEGSGAERMKQFLTSIGAEAFLDVEKQQFESDGSLKAYENPDDYAKRKVEKIDLAWLGAVYNHLAKGINYSVSIDFQAAGGAQATLLKNGQAQLTYAAQGDVNNNPIAVTEYIYENGFLTATKSLSYIVDLDSLKAANDEEKKKNEKEYKDNPLNEDGMKALYSQTNGSAKFKKSFTMMHMNAYGNPAYSTDATGNVLSQYTYNNSGGVQSIKDFTNGTTNFFSGGRFSYSVNAEGFMTSKIEYFQNGTTNYMMNYNNGVGTSITVFYNNQPAITASLANGEFLSANEYRQIYQDCKYPERPAQEWYTNEATADQKKAIDNLDALELYELTYEEDKDGEIKEHKGKQVNNSHNVNVEYAYITNMMEKYGITSFSVYANDLYNQAILRVLGLDEAFELALMQKQENDAQKELDSLPSEDELSSLWNNLEQSEKDELQKFKDNLESDEKTSDSEKEASTGLTETASKLSESAQKFAYYKTKRVEAENRLNNNNVANRRAAQMSIQKALELMKSFTNGHGAVLQATFSISNNVFNEVGETTYTYDGKKISAEEADEILNKDNENNKVITGSGSYERTINTETVNHEEKIEKSTARNTIEKKTLSISLTICAYGQAVVGYAAEHVLGSKTTPGDPLNTTLTHTWTETTTTVERYDPVIIGTQGGFVGEDGKALTNADGTPMTNEQIAEFIANGGTVYVSVNATDVNIMDGQGFQAVDGEEILVQVTDVDVFNTLADNVGKDVMLMGDVQTDVDGKKTIVMNLSYGGGFQTGSGIAQMKEVISKIEAGDTELSAKHAWIQQNLDANSWLSGVSGSLDAKWDMLVMNANSNGALEKAPRALLQIMAAVLTIF